MHVKKHQMSLAMQVLQALSMHVKSRGGSQKLLLAFLALSLN